MLVHEGDEIRTLYIEERDDTRSLCGHTEAILAHARHRSERRGWRLRREEGDVV